MNMGVHTKCVSVWILIALAFFCWFFPAACDVLFMLLTVESVCAVSWSHQLMKMDGRAQIFLNITESVRERLMSYMYKC